MCGRFVLMTPGRDLAERFGFEEEPVLEPHYNIAPTQMVAIIRLNKETGRRRLDFVRWGLVPFWSKDPSIGNKLINARGESATEKPAFRSAFKSRRCLVPVDGYYEWKKTKGGQKQPYLARNADGSPLLLKAALGHVQFETIHPFLDGNGRLGRLLITFLLCIEGALSEPLLYLSLYFKAHRDTYYDLLQRVRVEGDWEAWVTFFLEEVIETVEQGVTTAQRIMKLFTDDRTRVETMKQAAGNVLRVHSYLQKKPVLEIPRASQEIEISQPTVTSALKRLEEIGVVREIPGKARDRIYVYKEYLDILEEGGQPL